MALEVGMVAPAFTLLGSDGQMHSLQEYAGRTVVLYFYPKDNTPGCTKEACGFRDLQPQFEQLNAVVLGVSRDGAASHDRFVAQFKLPFVLLSDPETEVMALYGAYGEKMHYGKLIVGTTRTTTVIGPDGTVLKQWRKVPKAETHPAKVLEFLTSQE